MSKHKQKNEAELENPVDEAQVHETASETETSDRKPAEPGHTETEMPEQDSLAQDQALARQVAKLEQDLAKAIQERDENYNRMLRSQADFENFRRRTRQEFEQLVQSAGEDLVKKILPVLDSLERAVAAFNKEDASGGWREGVQLVLRQFQSILKAEGLEPVEALNSAFDPQIHEAVSQEESESVSETTVVEELQRGYRFRNRLIRPALVKVAVPKAPQTGTGEEKVSGG